MPELKVSRAYHEALRRIGVQNPGEVGVSSPVTLTAPVDDLSHLVPPITVPVVSWGGFGHAAAAGNHSGVHLACRAQGGTWVESFGDYSGTWLARLTRTPVATVNTVTVDLTQMTWPVAEPVQNVLTQEEWVAAVIIAGTVMRGDNSASIVGMPLYLRPGDHLYVFDNSANVTWDGNVIWREVPRGAFDQA